MIYDLKILYIPTVDQLENFLFNEASLVDIDQRHSILKKMDIIMELHKGFLKPDPAVQSLSQLLTSKSAEPISRSSLAHQISNSASPSAAQTKEMAAADETLSHQHLKIGIGSIDIRLSNKEI